MYRMLTVGTLVKTETQFHYTIARIKIQTNVEISSKPSPNFSIFLVFLNFRVILFPLPIRIVYSNFIFHPTI